MKRLFIAMALIVCMLPVRAQYADRKEADTVNNRPLAEFVAHQKMLWNFGWEFSLGKEPNAWRQVDLPHDFQFEQPWTKDGGGARGFKPMCEGWYRKTFVADSTWRGLNVKLLFDGIIYIGDVYINGEKVASTDYGYVGLEADLTKHLKWGEVNEVKVYASTGRRNGSRWYTGGGLFRDVYMKLENPTHIARHGVFVTTCDNDKINIQVEVTGWQKHDVTIKSHVIDASGKVVGTTQENMPEYTRQTSTEVKLPLITLNDVHLWSPDTPYLYSVDVLIYDGGVLVDSVREQFGVRKLEFSPEHGFKLNGKKLFLQGNSGHHDLGALGAASYDRAIERMMLQLKAFGYNTIRCSHNPYSESFTKIADRVGVLIIDELIDKWSDKDYWGGRQPFTHIWPGLIKEWVKRDRNSPSVILWSLGNELQINEKWTGYSDFEDWGVTMYRVMDTVVKRFDPTRLTTVAQFPARAGAIGHRDKAYKDYTVPPELAQATDVASLNYQSAWYGEFKKHCPDMNIFQSEAETSNWLEAYYNMDREHSIGMAYWGSIEYWGESNGWPKKGWNYSFFSHSMEPYPTAWLVKSAFCESEPMVHIGVLNAEGSESVSWNDIQVGQTSLLSHWNFPDGSRQRIYVFTNAPSVELLLNGKSLGTKPNNGQGNMRHVITWDVDYHSGSLLAIARDTEGKEVDRHDLHTAGKAVSLKIEEETNEWKAGGMDLKYLNITAVDAKGRIVPDYEEPLSIDVTGPATLLALDNGDHYTDEIFAGITTKKMRGGRMLVILRSQHEVGKVTVNASSGKFKSIYNTTTQ